MRDLLTEPLWHPEDLGKPIADSPHAVSVCLPLWEHVVGYEEGDEGVVDAMWCGYPRFVMHPKLEELHCKLLSDHGNEGEACLSFRDVEAALRCKEFIKGKGRVLEIPESRMAALFFAEKEFKKACIYRRHTGELVSSRQAQAYLQGQESRDGSESEMVIRNRLAEWNSQQAEDVYLYGNGMAAHYHLHRAIQCAITGNRSVQFGFPYVDILKVQQKFTPMVDFIWDIGDEGFGELERTLQAGGVISVYVELPNNPLLSMPDCQQLSDLCKKYQVPLIVDDTVGSYANIDSFLVADATYSSLTKYFNGACDVMGGTVILNPESAFYHKLKEALESEGGSGLYQEDATVLEINSRDYPLRMNRINQTAEQLADYLKNHSLVDRVYYPKYIDTPAYEFMKKSGGGYGGLLSIELVNAEEMAPTFYDRLRVNKGPTLGTNFTLACPYTLLAHYEELEWAESCGVSRWLIRIAVGLEDPQELITRFSEALDGET